MSRQMGFTKAGILLQPDLIQAESTVFFEELRKELKRKMVENDLMNF
jgi:hypothetical protein